MNFFNRFQDFGRSLIFYIGNHWKESFIKVNKTKQLILIALYSNLIRMEILLIKIEVLNQFIGNAMLRIIIYI